MTRTAEAVVTLGDGRRLAYRMWGEPAAQPVVFFHGTPGSRRFGPIDGIVEQVGVRLISFDRPGFGASSEREGRELLDTVDDVSALADHVGLGRFALLGWSAGGPHALACAARLGERVTEVAVASMPGPLDEVPGGWDALGDVMRPTAEMARHEPHRSRRSVMRYMQGWVDEPASYLGSGGPPGDRAVKADPRYRPMLVDDVSTALAPGAAGQADDLIAFWRPWGFTLGELREGVRVFHGAQDTRAEPDFQYLAGSLRAPSVTVWADQGHFGILPHFAAVLSALGQENLLA